MLLTILFALIPFLLILLLGFTVGYIYNFIVKVSGNGFRFFYKPTVFLGTPVHELCHASMCILFGHKIKDMKLLIIPPKDGTLGYVTHTYNPKSFYQRMGNFFIGIAPTTIVAFILCLGLFFVKDNFKDILFYIPESNFTGIGPILSTVFGNCKKLFVHFFDVDNLTNWKWWLYLFFAIQLASHMRMSPPDMQGAKTGLLLVTIVLVVLPILFNLIFTAGDVLRIEVGIVSTVCCLLAITIIMHIVLLVYALICRLMAKIFKQKNN